MEHAHVDPARRIWRYILARRAALHTARVRRFRRKSDALIQQTPPATVDPAAEIEIHTLTCEKDHLDLLWCLKTFLHFSGRPCNIVIHDDGSLTSEALQRLCQHLPGITMVSKTEAGDRMRSMLERYPACRGFRERLPLARRIFDFPAFASRERFVILDSDVLFFRRPDAMLHSIDRHRLFFMSDYQDGYVYSRAEIASRYGVDVLTRFNTGISCFRKDVFDWEFIERYCADIEAAGLQAHPWAEQALFAILLSRHRERVDRLPSEYAISQTPIGPSTVSHHYVNDGSRGMFYTHGIPYLRRTTFLAVPPKTVS